MSFARIKKVLILWFFVETARFVVYNEIGVVWRFGNGNHSKIKIIERGLLWKETKLMNFWSLPESTS